MTINELLKRLAQSCYIWPKHSDGRITYPAVSVTKGYGADPREFEALGGEVFVSQQGQNAGKLSWVIRNEEAYSLMQELRPYVNAMRLHAIDTWNDYSQPTRS